MPMRNAAASACRRSRAFGPIASVECRIALAAARRDATGTSSRGRAADGTTA
jgi:hypothetical protein